MGKRGKDSGKEGELTNFPEEGTLRLSNIRYLAVAASLILVFSAFAALFFEEQNLEGYATASITKVKTERLPDSRSIFPTLNLRTPPSISTEVPVNYYCPKTALSPPRQYARSANTNKCFVKTSGRNYDFMCTYKGNFGPLYIQCIPR